MQIHTPNVVQEGVDRPPPPPLPPPPPPPEFLMCCSIFETILPLLESLSSSLQDEIYFMGSGAARGL